MMVKPDGSDLCEACGGHLYSLTDDCNCDVERLQNENEWLVARIEEATKVMSTIRNRHDGSPHIVQKAERWLKTLNCHTRKG